MKKILILLMIITSCSSSNNNHESHGNHTKNDKKSNSLSPHTVAMSMIGGAHIHIDYSSPSIRNRIIFGGLLAYDQVWQSGAHNATWIETDYDLLVNGYELKKGRYGFFTIPSKDDWTIIFNKNWEQHGKDEYDQKDDVFRFKVKPIILDEIVESLKYEVDEIDENNGSISLSWEKVKVTIPFEIKR